MPRRTYGNGRRRAHVAPLDVDALLYELQRIAERRRQPRNATWRKAT